LWNPLLLWSIGAVSVSLIALSFELFWHKDDGQAA